MATLEERVATLALGTFDVLPNKSKPRVQPNGSTEWVPMSAIVLVQDSSSSLEKLTCVSLATGCKCLPTSAIPKCRGRVLHDSHAEILALRGLNYFLLSEVSVLIREGNVYQSPFIYARLPPSTQGNITNDSTVWQPFAIRPNISIHLFSTEAPCGDASMEILIAELGPEASTPWEQTPHTPLTPEQDSTDAISAPAPALLQGRSFFSALSLVRRKPSRADAEPTLSKSCTDKLTLKQATGLLSFPTYLFIAPNPDTYLSSLILPHNKYSAEACTRAFSSTGRLAPLQPDHLPNGHKFHPFTVQALPASFPPFSFSKPHPCPIPAQRPKPTNLSALYVQISHVSASPQAAAPVNETLLNGVKQGYVLNSHDARKASITSRSSLFQAGREIAQLLLQRQTPTLVPHPGEQWSRELKALVCARSYGEAKGLASLGKGGDEGKSLAVVAASDEEGGGGGEEGHKTSERRRIARQMVIDILPGSWPKNHGDKDWL